jgi:hypothetical protein
MARYLKRWESPRNEGRNDKGRGGSARQRQVKKQMKALRRKLKDADVGNPGGDSHPPSHSNHSKGRDSISSFFYGNIHLRHSATHLNQNQLFFRTVRSTVLKNNWRSLVLIPSTFPCPKVYPGFRYYF